VRFDLAGFGWGGPTFDIVLDEQKDEDFILDIEGVKFVAENDFAGLIDGLEIIKIAGKYKINSTGCCS
jgi:hypothetical protein